MKIMTQKKREELKEKAKESGLAVSSSSTGKMESSTSTGPAFSRPGNGENILAQADADEDDRNDALAALADAAGMGLD